MTSLLDKIGPLAAPAAVARHDAAEALKRRRDEASDQLKEKSEQLKEKAEQLKDKAEQLKDKEGALVRRFRKKRKHAAKALEKRLRKERKQAANALAARKEKVGRGLRTRRKKAEKAVREQQDKVKAAGGEISSRLSTVLPTKASPDLAPVAMIGIDRLLGDIRTGRFEKMMSALTAVGAAITAVEIWTEHDGASFGNKMMWLPVVIVPIAVPVGIASVFSRRVAKTALPALSAVVVANGLQGTYFHWRGIAQKPGGLRQNARYNIEMGPPALAPLLASMVGGMGILASILRREDEPKR